MSPRSCSYEALLIDLYQQGARGKTQDPNTPQRRSLYDLQRLIDEVFDGFAKGGALEGAEGAGDGARTCRAADLPAILIAFEEKRSVNLLDENEMEMLKAFAEQVSLNPALSS